MARRRSPGRDRRSHRHRARGLADHQVGSELARGYEGAVAQKVNAPYVWMPLCLLFLAPFFDPRRPFRLLHLDLLAILALGVSLYFFNRAEITASVLLTYPVLVYVFVRMLWAGLWSARERRGRWSRSPASAGSRSARSSLALARIALNVADSRVIDIGVAGVVGADRIEHGEPLYEGALLTGPRPPRRRLRPCQLPRLRPVRAGLPVGRRVGLGPGRPRRGDRLRPAGGARPASCSAAGCDAGARARALGVALAFAWLACPFTLYAMNANANDALVAALLVAAMLALGLGPGAGAFVALAAAAKFGSAALAPLFATATGERRLRSVIAVRARVRDRRRGRRRPVPPRRRPPRDLRPHARLPGDAELAVQHLGPGAVARLPAIADAGRGGGAGARGRVLAAAARRRCRSPRSPPRSRSPSRSERPTGSTSTSSGSCRSTWSRSSPRTVG